MMHPGWKIEVWQDPVDRAPFRLSKYWDKVNSGAQLADLIRLEVVLQHGGFYLDSDFALHKSLEPLRAYPFVIASEDGNELTNAFFGAAPESPVLTHLVDTLERNEANWQLPPYLTTGPSFFAQELKWRDDVTVILRDTFYPYNWHERAKTARLWTYGTHQWAYSWIATTGADQPLRALVRGLRRRLQKLRQWLLIKTRYFLLHLRHLLRVDRPQSFSASGIICAQTIHGPKIYLLGEDTSITPEIALHGTYEFREERFIQRVVRGGDWAIDVGANVGALSLLLAQKVGSFGRVFCYEPNPLPASLLKKSLVMNWLHDRTEVREKALGSDTCTMRLRFSRALLGGATLAAGGNAGTFENSIPLVSGAEEIDVEVSTLDSDFPVDLPIRLLKIDAEGFEHHVLRGGARLLEKQCVEILMLECLREVYGEKWNELVRELEKLVDYGYEPYVLSWSSKLKRIPLTRVLSGNRGRNVIFVANHAKNSIRGLS